MKFKKITIIGLGLMGGSLAAACRKKFPKAEIIGASRSPQAARTALRKKWIHRASASLEAIRSSDLIVVCTPVDTLKYFLEAIDMVARPGTLVTDVGSTKEEICQWAKRKLRRISFVGAHPMTGSHNRGIEAGDPKLYEDRLTFVVRTNTKGYAAVRDFWKKISGRIFEVDAARHDRIAAEISHLPHAAAACLVSAADKKSFPFAAGGFIDSTRIAQGDPSIWVPIFLSNRKALKSVFQRFEREFQAFKRLVLSGNASRLQAFLKAAGSKRKALKP